MVPVFMTFSDSLIRISEWRYFSKWNMSKTVHSYYWILIGSHMRSIEWC